MKRKILLLEQHLNSLSQDFEKRCNMSNTGKKVIDGRGARNCVREILN